MKIKKFDDFLNEKAISIDDVFYNEPYSGVALKHTSVLHEKK